MLHSVGKDLMFAVGLRQSDYFVPGAGFAPGWKRPDVCGGIETNRLVISANPASMSAVGKDLMFAVGLRRFAHPGATNNKPKKGLEKT